MPTTSRGERQPPRRARVGVWGGRRAGGTTARFTAQLVALVLPDRKDRIMVLHERHGVSQAALLRAVIDRGLPVLEAQFAEGSVEPASLA